MVLQIKKPAPKPIGAKPAAPAQSAAAPAKVAPAASTAKPGLSFLKRGAAAVAEMDKEEKRIEMSRKDKVFRFYLPDGGKGDITFLDGNLKDGILDVPYYYEHKQFMNGRHDNFFICTQDEEPCPICEGGGTASYVGILTVIDHSEFTSKRDNKVYKDTIKLFVAKRDTIKLLQEMAVKRGGLRGCRFDVSRHGDKSPNVGSAFDFTQKFTEAELKQMFPPIKSYDGKSMIDRTQPINYEAYLIEQYQPAKELRKLGFGAANAPVGAEDAGDGQPAEQYQM